MVEVDQQHDVGYERGDGPHADLVAAVALDEPGALRPQQIESQPEDAHAEPGLDGREVLGLDEPAGQDGYQDVGRHGEQQVGDDEAPEVGVPEADVYGCVLGIQGLNRIRSHWGSRRS